jgi:hypothetical protein
LWERNRLWLASGVDANSAGYYGWHHDRWCWSTDGEVWHTAHAQVGDLLPAPSGEHWIEVMGWPFETSAATPRPAEDDPGASSPLAPGSPADNWSDLPRTYHDDPDEFHWVRWVIPAISSVLANHIPMQLVPDGVILCARADSSPCAECADWEMWVAHVAPNVAVRIHAAAAAES